MIPVLLAPLLSTLASKGMSLLAGAIESKGKEFVEEKLGVKIPSDASQLTPELTQQLKELEMEHEEFLLEIQVKKAEINLKLETVAQEAVTKRWEADMLSDSYLSKNVRPIALLGTLQFVAIAAVLSAMGFKIDEVYILLLKELLSIMIGAYFVGRTVEKGLDVYQGWKHTKGE